MLKKLRTDLGNPSSASGVTGADAFAKIATLNADLTDKLSFAEGNSLFYMDTTTYYDYDGTNAWTAAKTQAIYNKMASHFSPYQSYGLIYLSNAQVWVGTYLFFPADNGYLSIHVHTYVPTTIKHFGIVNGNFFVD